MSVVNNFWIAPFFIISSNVISGICKVDTCTILILYSFTLELRIKFIRNYYENGWFFKKTYCEIGDFIVVNICLNLATNQRLMIRFVET